MLTWTAPNRIAAAVASNPAAKLSVVPTMGKTAPVWTVVAKETAASGAPRHQALATFAGKTAQKEAQNYAAGGFRQRVGRKDGGK